MKWLYRAECVAFTVFRFFLMLCALPCLHVYFFGTQACLWHDDWQRRLDRIKPHVD